MKKGLLLMVFAWLAFLDNAKADNLVISNVTVPQGGMAELAVGFNFTSATDKVGFTFKLNLPTGVELQKDEDEIPVYTTDASIKNLSVSCPGEGNFAGLPSNSSSTIKGTSGTLLTLRLLASEELAVGSTHTVNVTKGTFSQRVDGRTTDIVLEDFSFEVTIGEPADPRVILDETSTTPPEAASGVDVRVRRTILANEWSTICLPFAMTEAQVKTAFGEDVRLGDFNGIESENDDDENIVSISVKFTDATSIEANHPYIIKVSAPITEFTADGVDIDPEDEPSVDKDKQTVKVGKNTYTSYNRLIGSYVANTEIPDLTLFLSNNKFWYSKGATKMKAFRAYFDFYDVLTEVGDAAGSRISMTFTENDATGISDVNHETIINNRYNDLQGRPVVKPGKGIYIKEGKKVVIK